jgi:hypothetical protein
MNEAGAVRNIQAATHIERDHHRLRRAELTTSIAKIAQAATVEVLADHIVNGLIVPRCRASPYHLDEVRMTRAHHLLDRGGETLGKSGCRADLGMQDLDRHDAFGEEIGGLEDRNVEPNAAACPEPIPTADDAVGRCRTAHGFLGVAHRNSDAIASVAAPGRGPQETR